MKPTEHEIQNQLIEYLRLKNWYVIRLNSGAWKVGDRFIRFGEKGLPDLLAFREREALEYFHTDLLFIEVKRHGKKPEPEQITKMKELEEYGAICVVAHSLEELQQLGY